MSTRRMTERAIEIRRKFLADAIAKYGREVVEAWADDPVKVRAINALMQMEADDEAKREGG